MKEKAQSIGKAFAILSIANIFVKLLSLLFVPIMRNLLGGSEGYGVFGAANEVFAFIYVIATAGMPVAISKLVSELTATGNKKMSVNLFKFMRFLLIIIGTVLTILMMIFSKQIAGIVETPKSWLGIMFLAPTIFFCAILSAYRGYFQGIRNMVPTAMSQVVEQIVHVVISISMVIVFRSWGIIWAVAAASLGTTIGSFVALLIILKYHKMHVLTERREKRVYTKPTKRYTRKEIINKIIFYSIPITLSSGIQYAGNMIDIMILKKRLDVAGLGQFRDALYGDLLATRQLINVPNSMITSLCISILPAVAAAYILRNRKDTSERADYGFKLCYLVAFPAATVLSAFAKPVYQFLCLGSNYSLLMILAFSLLLLGTMQLQSAILQSVNSLFTTTFFLAISVIIKAILNYILIGIPSINVYGAIISTYLSYLVPLMLNQYILTKHKKLDISLLKNAWRPALGSALMLVFAVPTYFVLYGFTSRFMGGYFSNAVSFIITSLIGGAVYVFSMAKTGGLLKDDLDSISPAICRKLPNKIVRILWSE